jgi:arylsulfatase A-like enzyme
MIPRPFCAFRAPLMLVSILGLASALGHDLNGDPNAEDDHSVRRSELVRAQRAPQNRVQHGERLVRTNRPAQAAGEGSGALMASSQISPPPASPAGNGTLMSASFSPFKPNVRFYNDAAYLYVESDSMPDAAFMPNPMVGITSWQQQLPIPIGYFGNITNPESDTGSLGYGQPNVWRIPLVPVPAASPILLTGNFLRGAVALAANGIPIFNPRNNTGQFSYAIGELDQYGGHCGRADDYHYHIAPTHLYSVLTADKPCAWGLDGYPIYGYTEPDGSAMQALDADGGHDIGNGWGYHYHARGAFSGGTWTPATPYLMNAMHGTVVSYGGQIDPQPTANSIAPAGSPLAGAVITSFSRPTVDSYVLTYTVGNTTYTVSWSVDRITHVVTVTHPTPNNPNPAPATYTNIGRFNSYPMSGRSLAKLPDTGQTLSATATFGEDSDYSINAPSFTDNGNGTVSDVVTGLMWQKTDSGEMTWDTARTSAAALNLAGFADWRLPTAQEALSILNHERNPAHDPAYFVNNASGTPGYFWTSDLFYGDNSKVWATNTGGGLGPHPKTSTISAGGTQRFHARYVRGAKPTTGHNYLNNNDGTITDLDTALMWTQALSSSMTWESALAYAEGLTTGGYGDWRLPNVKELQSLLDLTRATATGSAATPCLNRTLFPTATATAYWSSTSLKQQTPTQAWLVDFGVNTTSNPPRNQQGIVSYESYASSYPVFAVRSTTISTLTPPTILSVTAVPTVPSNLDTPVISAMVTPASGATIASVQLTYSAGTQVTATVFDETMSSTATGGAGGWEGTGAVHPWTVTSTAGAGNVKQSTVSNHTPSGQGGTCGLEFGKGSSSATATMAQTTNAIDATGTSGYVEFWAATSNFTSGLGWNFQLSTDNITWNTRLSESAGTNHSHQLYRYDLAASERVATLRIRFQFVGNGTGGPTGPKTYVDDISVVTTTGVAPVMVSMTGAASGGVFTSPSLPAQVSGTAVGYTIVATDSKGSSSSATGSYTTGPAPSLTTGPTLPQATLGGAYSQTLAASSGTGPTYTWSVNAGSTLPPGLTLSDAGVLSGTVPTPDTYTFTLKVTDSAGRIATKAFTLLVSTSTLPNVVIFVTDDQGWGDISYHTPAGQVPVQTPNMERIGTEGIRLEKFYATPVCATSRCSLLTGRSTLRTNSGNQRGVDVSEHMMPQTFKAAGYQTFMCGKWHLGGWSNDTYTTTLNGSTVLVQHEGADYHPRNRGWDLHYGQYGGAINYFSHTSVDPELSGRLDWWLNDASVIETIDLQGNGGYSTDLLADKAVSQIVNRDKSKPMLLYVAFNGVHAGVQAPQSYVSKYAALGVTNSARRTLCAALDCMDVAMGRVLTALDSEGITNNTLVLYLSDNGGNEPTGSFNDPLRGTKNDSYDGGIHTPAALRWPGVLAAGVTSNQYVWIGDIFPTLCEAVGVTPQNTRPFDGINLWSTLQSITAANPNGVTRPVPLVTGSSTPVALNTFTDPVNGGSKIFKLIRNRSGQTITNELFNMTDDPYESSDLALGANASSYSAIVTSLTSAVTSMSAVNYAPYIGPPGIAQTVQQGNATTLHAPFTSYGRVPSVQWRKNGGNIAGATSYYQITDSGSPVNGIYMATLMLTNVNSTHTGNYDVIVNSANGTATSASGALTVIHPVSTLNDGLPDNWKLAHGIDPNSTSAINGPLGDLDDDGRVNLFEYSFNTDPRTAESDPFQSTIATKIGDGLNYLQVSFPRRIGALDFNHTVETSDNLATWFSSDNTEPVSIVANADGITETVTMRILPAITSGAKRFARLKVTTQ